MDHPATNAAMFVPTHKYLKTMEIKLYKLYA